MSKVIDGTPPAPAPSTYTATMSCVPAGGGAPVSYTVPPLPADGSLVTVAGVVIGSMCTVVEPTPPTGATVTYIPAQPFVAVDGGSVAVQNTFGVQRTMAIAKGVRGTPPDTAPTGYSVSITCIPPNAGPTDSETVTIPPNDTVSTTGLFRIGSSCTLEELNPPAGATVTYSPSQTFIFTQAIADEEIVLHVFNTFPTAPALVSQSASEAAAVAASKARRLAEAGDQSVALGAFGATVVAVGFAVLLMRRRHRA